ncbi:MAG: RNA pyrophosphohydrolase, partial [Proteobacteria bacterium]|nr:RNA pyrophosphohydrolase [Pseudomonadota bacterium]
EHSAFRELEEEIGTNNAEIIARIKGWLFYDLPDDLVGKVWGGKFRGQKQIWFLMRFLGSDSDINLETDHPEFNAWRWVDIAKVPELIVPFKRDLYLAILKEFQPFLDN